MEKRKNKKLIVLNCVQTSDKVRDRKASINKFLSSAGGIKPRALHMLDKCPTSYLYI